MSLTFQDAQRKARYGHRPWIFYRDRTGTAHAHRAEAEAIKAALLAEGTKGRWTLFCGDGTPMLMTWRLGLIALSNAKIGMLS